MATGRRVATCLLCWLISGCSGSPIQSRETPLTVGVWTDGSVCLTVTVEACELTAGCGHGQFPRPIVRADGTFETDGTYRIEVGPVGIDPAPPAHFSGVVDGATLTLKVVPAASGLAGATYIMRRGSVLGCPRCL